MSVLPIVDRELRVAARRKGTYQMRFWSALGMFALWAGLPIAIRHTSPAQMGHYLLVSLGVLALAVSMLAGVFLTSDSLSEEKREGTIGLLFLTNLKGHDVVLGKMAAHSLHAFFGLLAMLPILGLTLLMGGVTGFEFARLSLVFIATLVFSLGLGMGVSAVCREARQAIGTTFLLMVVCAGICPALWWVLKLILGSSSWWDFLLWPSPASAYIFGLSDNYPFSNGSVLFWRSVTTLFMLGVGAMILATVVLPRCWQERSAAPNAKKRSAPPPQTVKAKFTDREILLRYEPASWLAARDASPRRAVFRMLLLYVPVWLCALVISLTTSWWKEGYTLALFASYAMHISVKTLMAVEASRRMNQDRRSGAWELLLVTPLTVKSILEGQMKALGRQFKGAIVTLGLVNLAMLAAALFWSKQLNMQKDDQWIFAEMFIGGAIVLLFDFFALGWVGMWRGLKARQHHRAVLGTLSQLMGGPLVAAFLLIVIRPDFGSAAGPMIFLTLWFGMAVVLDFASSLVARKRLLNEFRNVVLTNG